MVAKQKIMYVCPWPKCGFKFDKMIGACSSNSSKNIGSVTDQVQCPACKNFMKS